MGDGGGWVAASLSGAGLGLAFFFLDLRLSRRHAIGAWLRPSSNLRRLFDHRGQRRQKAAAAEGKVLDMYSFTARPGDGPHEPGRPPVSAADAKRVDALLDKIAKQGREGLTAEELEFLQRASKKYR